MKNPKSLLLIDDDPLFCSVFEHYAEQRNIPVYSYASFDEFDGSPDRDYDVVVMDYDLTDINGIEFAEYIYCVQGNIPVMLISNSKRNLQRKDLLPCNVKTLCEKALGVEEVLNNAITTLSIPRSRKKVKYFK